MIIITRYYRTAIDSISGEERGRTRGEGGSSRFSRGRKKRARPNSSRARFPRKSSGATPHRSVSQGMKSLPVFPSRRRVFADTNSPHPKSTDPALLARSFLPKQWMKAFSHIEVYKRNKQVQCMSCYTDIDPSRIKVSNTRPRLVCRSLIYDPCTKRYSIRSRSNNNDYTVSERKPFKDTSEQWWVSKLRQKGRCRD